MSRDRTLSDDVKLYPGSKFPGDRVIHLYGQRFDLATIAWAMREFVQNEVRRRRYDPNIQHWKYDPAEFAMAFFTEAIAAEDEDAFVEVCRRFRLWRYYR